MNPGDPTGTFCDCLLPDRRPENGNLYCAECGRQIPEARDQLLVLVARSVRHRDPEWASERVEMALAVLGART